MPNPTVPILFLTAVTVMIAPESASSQAPPVAAVETRVPELDFRTGVPWDRVGVAEGSHDLSDRMGAYAVPGLSVAVIDDDAVVWAKAYGVLAAGNGPDVTTDTRFEAGSTTKLVTALAVLRLVADDRFDLDDPVDDHLAAWRIPDNAWTAVEPVTVRRLLTHTAGVNRPEGGFPVDTTGAPTLVQVLNGEPPALNPPLAVEFTPGSRHQYSNFGYIVLQQLVEDVSGRPFAEAVRDLVLDPLGMAASAFSPPGEAPRPHGPDGLPQASIPHPSALGQGGLWSTPSDLARLAIRLMESYQGTSGPAITTATARTMIDTRTAVDPAQAMGFRTEGIGVFLLDTEHGPAFCHPGFNAPGATCVLIGLPETGQGAVVMTNGAMGLQLSLELISSIAAAYDWPSFRMVTE